MKQATKFFALIIAIASICVTACKNEPQITQGEVRVIEEPKLNDEDTVIFAGCMPSIIPKKLIGFYVRVADMGRTFATDTIGWQKAGLIPWMRGLEQMGKKGNCDFTVKIPYDTLQPSKTFTLRIVADSTGITLLQTPNVKLTDFSSSDKMLYAFEEVKTNGKFPGYNTGKLKVKLIEEEMKIGFDEGSETTRRELTAVTNNFFYLFNRYDKYRTKG